MSTRFSILLLFFLLSFGVVAQNEAFVLPEASKKAKKLYTKYIQESALLSQAQKKESLEKILKKYPNFIDIQMNYAQVLFDVGETDHAIELAEQVLSSHPEYKPLYQKLTSTFYREKQDIEKEAYWLRSYLLLNISDKSRKKAEKRLQQLELIKDILVNSPRVDLEILSDAINTESYAEYKPVISLDNQRIIFTRRVNGQEDFYSSIKKENIWQPAQELNALNSAGNEGAHAISPNGKYMIYTRCDAPNRYRSCDLYVSKYSVSGWGEPQYLSMINTTSWESQACFSPDGETILFSSDRKGGAGGRDLYSITRVNGEWGSVKNLGEPLNTAGNEESPFIHPDGRTLYFMSDGHAGLGGQDLFYSKKGLDGRWSKPINMGSYINSTKDEGGLFVDLDGEYAYFSKTQKNLDGLDSDIYRFKLPEALKPDPVSYISLLVYDKETNERINAKASLQNTAVPFQKTLKLSAIESNVEIISSDQSYSLTIEKDGYLFHSENINPQDRDNPSDPIQYKIYLQPLPKSVKKDTMEAVALRNIYFETGQAKLLDKSFFELDRLVNLLSKEQNALVKINGHTDNVGNEEDNVILSRQRAEAVKDYLVLKGIATQRIIIQAFGESRPISSNETKEGRAQNRRIEFQLIYP